VRDATPRELQTPESYLGSERLQRYVGSRIRPGVAAGYTFATALAEDELTYAGTWRVERQQIVAGAGARLRLHFRAQFVYLVLGGRGTVHALVDGTPTRSFRVDADRLYTILSGTSSRDGILELRFSPGVTAYAFTFG
jgi:hypothetical protein